MNILILVFIFLFGIVIGSFLNVCIYRIPAEKSIASSGSACQSCGAKLTFIDLIPVISYIALRGKCRHCKAKISMQYPMVELITGILFLLLYLKFGLIWQTLVYAILLCLLIVVTVIDYRHMIIPNGLVIAGLIVGTLQLAAVLITKQIFSIELFTDPFRDSNWLTYVIGLFAGALPLFIIAAFATYVLKKEAIGGGDIKLMAFVGLILGWKILIPAYFIGIVIGALASIVLLASGRKKRGDQIPFGPFLCLGSAVSVFFGSEIINWYIGLLS